MTGNYDSLRKEMKFIETVDRLTESSYLVNDVVLLYKQLWLLAPRRSHPLVPAKCPFF